MSLDDENQGFVISYNNCPASLAKNKSCSIKVTFDAKNATPGSKSSNLNYDNVFVNLTATKDAPPAPETVSLVGQAQIQVSGVQASAVDFGDLSTKETVIKSLTIKNIGTASIPASPVALTGTDFALSYDACSTKALAKGASCSIKISLSGANKEGSISSTLSYKDLSATLSAKVITPAIAAADPNSSLKANIQLMDGTSVAAASKNAGSFSGSQSVVVTLSAKNTGNLAGSTATAQLSDSTNFALSYNTCNNVSLGINSSCSMKVTFGASGKQPGDYTTTLSFSGQSIVLNATVTAALPTCGTGTHLEETTCVSNTRTCVTLPAGATAGTETWTGTGYGACVVSACNLASHHLAGGICVANLPTCGAGTHLEETTCVSDTRVCVTLPSGASAGNETWSSGIWGACQITACSDSNKHVDSNTCVDNSRACTASNGPGSQTWNTSSLSWNTCASTNCSSGQYYDDGSGLCLTNNLSCSDMADPYAASGQKNFNYQTQTWSQCLITSCLNGYTAQGLQSYSTNGLGFNYYTSCQETESQGVSLIYDGTVGTQNLGSSGKCVNWDYYDEYACTDAGLTYEWGVFDPWSGTCYDPSKTDELSCLLAGGSFNYNHGYSYRYALSSSMSILNSNLKSSENSTSIFPSSLNKAVIRLSSYSPTTGSCNTLMTSNGSSNEQLSNLGCIYQSGDESMVGDGNGNVFMLSANPLINSNTSYKYNRLMKTNLTNSGSSVLATLPLNYGGIYWIKYIQGFIYISAYAEGASYNILRVNAVTGALQNLATTGYSQSGSYSSTIFDGDLYVYTYASSSYNLYRVNLTTGALNTVGTGLANADSLKVYGGNKLLRAFKPGYSVAPQLQVLNSAKTGFDVLYTASGSSGSMSFPDVLDGGYQTFVIYNNSGNYRYDYGKTNATVGGTSITSTGNYNYLYPAGVTISSSGVPSYLVDNGTNRIFINWDGNGNRGVYLKNVASGSITNLIAGTGLTDNDGYVLENDMGNGQLKTTMLSKGNDDKYYFATQYWNYSGWGGGGNQTHVWVVSKDSGSWEVSLVGVQYMNGQLMNTDAESSPLVIGNHVVFWHRYEYNDGYSYNTTNYALDMNTSSGTLSDIDYSISNQRLRTAITGMLESQSYKLSNGNFLSIIQVDGYHGRELYSVTPW